MTPLKHRVYRSLSRLYGLLRPHPEPGLRVLMYHSVGTRLPDDPYGTGIAKELFELHAQHLASAPLMITFDDGYKDTLTTAAPILAKHALRFTLFATTGFIRGGSPLYLSPQELKELSRLPGASVGAHGATHRRLTDLSDGDLKEELASSRKYLEDLLGRPVTALSYPHGAVDLRVRDAARAAGYTWGGTSRYGPNGPDRDPLLLCRTEITAWDSVEDLALKASGAWDWFRFRHKDPQ